MEAFGNRPLRGSILVAIAASLLAGCSEGAADETTVGAGGPASWYVTIDGARHGPYSGDELVSEVAAGRFGPTALAWSGAGDWVPLWSALHAHGLASSAAQSDQAGQAFLRVCAGVESVPEDDIRALAEFVKGADVSTPPAHVVELVRAHAGLLRDARDGTAKQGRIGLNYGLGPELLLEHQGQARRLTYLLQADAIVSAREGDIETAARDCAALARLARQARADRVVITSLSSMALAAAAIRTADRTLRGGSPSAAARDELRQATAWIQERDPFFMVDAIEVERLYTVEAMSREYADGIRQAGVDLEADVAQCLQVFDAVVEAARGADSGRLSTLHAQIDRGDHGMLAVPVVLPMIRGVQRAMNAEAEIRAGFGRIAQ